MRKSEEIIHFKKCSKCKIIKESQEFRIRKDKRVVGRFYINPSCRKCERLYTKQWYNKNKEDLNFKTQAAKRAREYYYKNHTIVLEKERKRHHSKEYRTYMKNYRLKNKEKIALLHDPIVKKFHEKMRDTLSDSYIIKLLMVDGKLTRKEILEYPKLIEAKREQIKILRLLN